MKNIFFILVSLSLIFLGAKDYFLSGKISELTQKIQNAENIADSFYCPQAERTSIPKSQKRWEVGDVISPRAGNYHCNLNYLKGQQEAYYKILRALK